MNALTDGFGGGMSETDVLILLSVLLAVVVVVVLAIALIDGARAAWRRSPRASRRSAPRWRASRPSTCARSSRRGQGDQRAVRHHPRRAARHRPQGRDRGGEEAAMTLWWIGNIVLLVVVVPVVVYLLHGVLRSHAEHRPERAQRSRRVTAAASEGPRRRGAAADHAGPGAQTVAGVAELRRLARRDPRRRVRGGPCPHRRSSRSSRSSLIVLALVYYLVSTILALRKITKGLDEVIGSVGEILEKSAPVNES